MGIGIGLVEEEEEEEMGVLVVRRERWMSGKIVNLGGCHHHGCTMSSSWSLRCFVGLDFLEREYGCRDENQLLQGTSCLLCARDWLEKIRWGFTDFGVSHGP